MFDMLPSDVAFTTFLSSLTGPRVRRAVRPKFRGDELARYRQFRPGRVRKAPVYVPTDEQIEVAMAAIRKSRESK